MDFEAHPTHYKGQLFRSKSEAIFARALELVGYEHWEYEPERFRVGDWTPDFWIVRSFKSKRLSKQVISSILLEYKPTPVTPSYRDLLAERFAKILERSFPDSLSTALVFGTPFDLSVKREVWEFINGEWSLVNTVLLLRLDEAKNYRFDLNV